MLILFTAVWGGVINLGIEIIAGRLLAPHFGSALDQWAALIGVALLAYSIGYFFHRKLTRGGPFPLLAVGGLYVLLLPLWVFSALDGLLDWPLQLACIMGAVLTCGLPSVLWAALLPYLQERGRQGRSAWMLAWSCLGNLFGAWGAAFLFIPYFGTHVTLLGLGCSALLLSLFWIKESRARWRGAEMAIFVLALAGGIWANQSGLARLRQPWINAYGSDPEAKKTLIHRRDSAYQSIAVWDEEGARGKHRGLALNGKLQFLWNESEKLNLDSKYEYYNYAAAAVGWTQAKATPVRAKKVLIIGLGGGLIPWSIHQFHPDTEITCLELDGAVTDAALKYLPLGRAGKVTVLTGDGRQLLRASKEQYDYILVDTFLYSYVPFHLTTREFFDLARTRLAPGGVVVANFHRIFEETGLLQKLERTMAAAFPSVGVIHLPQRNTFILGAAEKGRSFEQDLLAGRKNLAAPLADLSKKAADLVVQSLPYAGEDVMTDDRNDTELRLYQTRRYLLLSRPI